MKQITTLKGRPLLFASFKNPKTKLLGFQAADDTRMLQIQKTSTNFLRIYSSKNTICIPAKDLFFKISLKLRFSGVLHQRRE